MQEVIVFGIGRFYKSRETILKEQCKIIAYLDNRVEQNEKQYYKGSDIPVYHPCSLCDDRLQHENCKILLMSVTTKQMSAQLCDMGIDIIRIVDGDIFCRDLRRKQCRKKNPLIEEIAQMQIEPASRFFGSERGKPIDRYYIETFLEQNSQYICGDTLEIAENTYTIKYGKGNVKNAYVLHLEGWGENAIKGDLATGEGIEEEKYDCVIITQTLMFIFDIQSAARNIYKMLKKGGTALITVAGISQISRYDADNWGSYYSFHEDAISKLFEPLFETENMIVKSYGNVKTAMAMLYGCCCEDLPAESFTIQDQDYPVIITALLHKR